MRPVSRSGVRSLYLLALAAIMLLLFSSAYIHHYRPCLPWVCLVVHSLVSLPINAHCTTTVCINIITLFSLAAENLLYVCI